MKPRRCQNKAHCLSCQLAPILFWLIVWTLLAQGAKYLPTPFETIRAMVALLTEATTYRIILRSGIRVILGFALASLLAILLAELPESMQGFIQLPVKILRAIPVAILALILVFFLAPQSLSLWIPLAVVLPLVYSQARAGKLAAPEETRELLQIYPVGFWQYLRFFYLPQRIPYWQVALEQSFGLAMKSMVAAEVLTLPDHSLGAAVYDAKLYLNLDILLAWAIVILVLAALGEWVLKKLLHLWSKHLEQSVGDTFAKDVSLDEVHNPLITLRHLDFSYGTEKIIDDLNYTFKSPKTYQIQGVTGRGKTTLLKIILGILEPSAGSIQKPAGLSLSVVQQDDVFLPGLSVINQLRAVSPHRLQDLNLILKKCGLDDPQALPSMLSGGMKRQLALARALAVPSHGLILDEAFTGMDPGLKQKLITLIKEETKDKLLIFVSHEAEALEDSFSQTKSVYSVDMNE